MPMLVRVSVWNGYQWEFRQSNYNEIYSRRLSISFNYKFGKLNGEIRKSKKEISNDDVSSGGRQ